MEYLIGVIAGIVIFGTSQLVSMLIKMSSAVEQMTRLLYELGARVMRIEQMGHVTMNASEGFVEALRQSAMDAPPNRSIDDQFRDLRDKFQEGIDDFEDDEDGDDENKNWK